MAPKGAKRVPKRPSRNPMNIIIFVKMTISWSKYCMSGKCPKYAKVMTKWSEGSPKRSQRMTKETQRALKNPNGPAQKEYSDQLGSQNGSKMEVKMSQIADGRPLRNMHRHERIAYLTLLGRSIFVVKTTLEQKTQKNDIRTPKELQNDPQVVQRDAQRARKGAQRVPKGPQRDPKGLQNGAKNHLGTPCGIFEILKS